MICVRDKLSMYLFTGTKMYWAKQNVHTLIFNLNMIKKTWIRYGGIQFSMSSLAEIINKKVNNVCFSYNSSPNKL